MRKTYEPGLDFNLQTREMWINESLFPYVKTLFKDNFNLPFVSETPVLNDPSVTLVTLESDIEEVTFKEHLETLNPGQYAEEAKKYYSKISKK